MYQQLPSQCEETFFSALIPETVKKKVRRIHFNLCRGNYEAITKSSSSQPLSQQLQNRWKGKKDPVSTSVESATKPMQKKANTYLHFNRSNNKHLCLNFDSKDNTKKRLFLHQSQQLQSLYNTKIISPSVAPTATQALKKVYLHLSSSHCKATAKESSTQPLFQQLPSRYKQHFFSALVPRTMTRKLRKSHLNLCQNNHRNAKKSSSRSLSQQAQIDCKEKDHLYLSLTIFKMNAKKRSSLPQLQQLLSKCEFHLYLSKCIYLSRSNNEMNMKENLTLPQSHVHVQQKKVLLDLNLSNSKTKAKGRSSLTQSKQQQQYRKCTFFHHNEIQLNLPANFLAVCDTMLSSNKKYIALILSVIHVLLTTFISLKCNYTFDPTFMTFCGALSNTFIFFNTMFQSLPTMMRFNLQQSTDNACLLGLRQSSILLSFRTSKTTRRDRHGELRSEEWLPVCSELAGGVRTWHFSR